MPNFSGLWTADQQFQAVGGSTWPSLPGAPTSVVATATSGTAASVAFTAPSSAGFPASITGYIVTSSPGGLTTTGASSPITVSGLTAGTAYTFTVRATNATGIGPSSAASNSVTPVNTFVDDVFSTYTYIGTGAAQTITNGIDLANKGGLIWTKDRNNAVDHILVDTARGNTKVLNTNNTSAEQTTSGTSTITGFNSNGYGLGNDTNAWVNTSGRPYVSWVFRKQPKFFDIVTYTGNGAASRSIAHSLGSKPGCIIVKCLSNSGTGWSTANRDSATIVSMRYFNHHSNANFTPIQDDNNYLHLGTSSTFNVTANFEDYEGFAGAGTHSTNGTGRTYVAYLFAHDAGGFGTSGTDNIISCGFYNGNGSTTGPVVSVGFEPQWVMVKKSSGGTVSTSSSSWVIFDTMRGLTDSDRNDLYLCPNLSNVEGDLGSSNFLRPTSTGFQPQSGADLTNESGASYIYIAIRRPNKPPTVGTSVFNAIARTGTNATATISGVGFPPDLVNSRNRVASFQNLTVDRLRGPTKRLMFDASDAEDTQANAITGFTMDGLTVGQDGTGAVNYSSDSYITHFFRRAPTFFDVVCYTGTGSARTVAHNLGVAPELMIIKSRTDTWNWAVYHSALGNTKFTLLDSNGGPVTQSTVWNNTSPTSSVFTVGSAGYTNASAGNYVAYLFATCAGVSKVGSYTGNGSTQTIDCGFTSGARFVLIKRSQDGFSGDWYVFDTVRGIISGNDPFFTLDAAGAETTNTDYIDPYSAGFELSSTAPADLNASGGTYIFLAIA